MKNKFNIKVKEIKFNIEFNQFLAIFIYSKLRNLCFVLHLI